MIKIACLSVSISQTSFSPFAPTQTFKLEFDLLLDTTALPRKGFESTILFTQLTDKKK